MVFGHKMKVSHMFLHGGNSTLFEIKLLPTLRDTILTQSQC